MAIPIRLLIIGAIRGNDQQGKNVYIFIKRSISAVIIFILTFGVLELSLRLWDPIGVEYFFQTGRYFAAMRPDAVYAYIHQSGFKNKFQGVDVIINSHGLRGPEFDEVKPSGKKRILILGDSVVFGWGVPQENIFAQELQRYFDRAVPEVEVIPAGVGSWNTRSEYEYLGSTAINFKPDVVLLLIVENDHEPHVSGHTDVSKEQLFLKADQEKTASNVVEKYIRENVWHKLVYKVHVLQYIYYFAKFRKMQSHIEENSPKWVDARLALNGVIKLCHEKGVDLLIYLYGSQSRVMENSVLNLYDKYLKSIGVDAVLLPELLFEKSDYRNSVVDGHPNIAGHKIIAQEMFKKLLPLVNDKKSLPSRCY